MTSAPHWHLGMRAQERYSQIIGVVVGIATYAHSSTEIQLLRFGLDADGQPYVPKWYPADQLTVAPEFEP